MIGFCRGHADADREANAAGIRFHRLPLDHFPKAFGGDTGRFESGIRQDDHEFLAAEAAAEIGGAECGPADFGESDQDKIAIGVPVTVVDAFEMIDIHQA